MSSREKKVLASLQDYGQDLTGVQNLKKKLQRLLGELKNHELRIETLFKQGDEFKIDHPIHDDEIAQKCEELAINWNDLKDTTNSRCTFFLSCCNEISNIFLLVFFL